LTPALGALALAGLLGRLLSWQWPGDVPGIPDGLLALGPVQVGVALVGAALLVRAERLSRA
jgi:hypothetical protein